MSRQTFAWGQSRSKLRQEERWLESLCIVGLLLAALILFCTNLGGLPLRDWDEGTVAQVAKEIWQAPADSLTWLFPTLWGEPYFNKPPLLHDLIALSYFVMGVNEWSTRLPGALLSAFSVPLLYSIGREIFVVRTPAIFSALIYLTFLPVVRQGRLAMLDGAVLCFSLLTILCVLRSRRDLRWALGAGLGVVLLCLTKGMMGLLIGAIAILFIAWDTPRLLSSIYLWGGLFLGCTPVIAWYTAQWLHYQEAFLEQGIIEQSLQRIYTPVDGNSGPFWYYGWEIFKYSWPWLLFCLGGLKLAWSCRNWGWAKLILIWSSVYFTAVSVMATKLPWYILPIYPALALAGGVQLAEICNLPSTNAYPRVWTFTMGLLALGTTVGSLYFAWSERELFVVITLSAMSLTTCIATVLLMQRDRQFIPVLIWGTYISLLLLVCSPHWVWELNEAYAVKPVAAIINHGVPAHQVVYTSFAYERPSLNFYSNHQVVPAQESQLLQYWQEQPSPYLLLDDVTFEQLNLKGVQLVGTAPPHWKLITKEERLESL